jgi:ubiquinone biosynthesis monooxygenase Coq7
MAEAHVRAAPVFPGDGAKERRIAQMLRVDHAGEFGAVHIYRGQLAIFGASEETARTAAIIEDMEAGERAHLETFDQLLLERAVRPTVMAPIWRAAGYALGAATALMGERAAHACTAAVEEVIEEHYARQGEALADLDPALAETVERFRLDEAGHRETALAEGAEQAPGYRLLSAAIKAGCRAAIQISQRI